MTCILSKCPHAKQGRCKVLGQCGADYALSQANQGGGYVVHIERNRTIDALLKAGLVRIQGTRGRGTVIVASGAA